MSTGDSESQISDKDKAWHMAEAEKPAREFGIRAEKRGDASMKAYNVRTAEKRAGGYKRILALWESRNITEEKKQSRKYWLKTLWRKSI